MKRRGVQREWRSLGNDPIPATHAVICDSICPEGTTGRQTGKPEKREREGRE